MNLIIQRSFYLKLDRQLKYISFDKPRAAHKFRKDIFVKIKEIPSRPMSYKKSDFFEDERFREMIFKGYRVVFEIRKDLIVVFAFHNWEDDLK